MSYYKQTVTVSAHCRCQVPENVIRENVVKQRILPVVLLIFYVLKHKTIFHIAFP